LTSKTSMRIIGHNLNADRHKNDFYPTPPEATLALLSKEKFEGNIWECACGDGAISKILINKGYDVYSSDLYDMGYGDSGIDFLMSDKQVDNIITNPPFRISTEFTLKALELVKHKAVFMHKLTYLEGINRYREIFKHKKLKNIYVFSKRVNFVKNGKSSGLMCFAWFVFDKNYEGLPQLDWL
jgi:hypothetical protein